jgi:hypothetical protein
MTLSIALMEMTTGSPHFCLSRKTSESLLSQHTHKSLSIKVADRAESGVSQGLFSAQKSGV